MGARVGRLGPSKESKSLCRGTSSDLGFQVLEGYTAIVDACCHSWNALMAMPDVLRSITHRDYIQVRI